MIEAKHRTANYPTRDAFEAHLVGKAWRDEQFRQRLLGQPRDAIRSELQRVTNDQIAGLDKVEFQILEETPNRIYIVLPPRPRPFDSPDGELTDAEMELVAGGGGETTGWRCIPFTDSGCF